MYHCPSLWFYVTICFHAHVIIISISPAACGLRWNVNFHHDLHGSHKNSPIFTTATPPRSHNQNLLLCWVGWAHPRRMREHPPLHPRLHDPSHNKSTQLSHTAKSTQVSAIPSKPQSIHWIECIIWIYLVTKPNVSLVVNASSRHLTFTCI